MQIIDKLHIVVSTLDELKTVLTENNDYTYVYLDNDITLTEGFLLNDKKERITIDGTYQNVSHTLTNYNTDEYGVITATETNYNIVIKNMKIISSHPYGVIYVPSDALYSSVTAEYNNITFNGVQLSYNYYGITKIINSTITVEETNSVAAQRVCDCNKIIIGGKTNITSSATTSTVFLLKNDTSYLKFLSYSDVTITTNKEIMNGTTKMDFSIYHDAVVNFITGNGFAITPSHGANNVLIEKRATFNFIENNHARIPMWNVYGDFTINEEAKVFVLNTYSTTPIDNYNIYFKGSNQNLILNNPANFTVYTKNSNVLCTVNPVNLNFKFKRINMWTDSMDYKDFGTISNLPTLSWYKDTDIAEVTGILNAGSTSISKTNFTPDELSNLPDLSNFSFQKRKGLSFGTIITNMHPINGTSTSISVYTKALAGVKIEYDEVSQIVTADDEGLFTYDVDTPLTDGTTVKITSCSDYVYAERQITSPFTGELTLFDCPSSVTFSSYLPNINPKIKETTIKVADSRQTHTDWKLYVSIEKPLESVSGFKLPNALVFKNFDNSITTLNEVPTLIFTSTSVSSIAQMHKLTYSKEKGILLDLTNKYLEKNEEYQTNIIWNIEE